MRWRARGVLLAALVAAVLAVGAFGVGRAEAAPLVSYACDVAPTDCSGWHATDVTLSWSVLGAQTISGCEGGTFTQDGVYKRTCSASDDTTTTSVTVTVRVDKTPPQVTGATTSRPPDAGPWYNHAVSVAFAGTDGGSGVASCSQVTYQGPDSAAATLVGTCRDAAGNTSPAAPFVLHYDATPPKVTGASPSRRPDSGAWYNHPLGLTFRGTDALSGIATCSQVVYGGPDAATASASGTCRDNAGNVSGPLPFGLRYDRTPPLLSAPSAQPGVGHVRLRWHVSDDVAFVKVLRSPGLRGARPSVIYRGRGAGNIDRRVRNRVGYLYRVIATDEAGNRTASRLRVRPGWRLLAPVPGQRVASPPRLRWTAVTGARYYNVQLFRRGQKILSTWPSRSQLRLTGDWRYAGRHRRLHPGRYSVYVWPGLGPPSARRFGPLLGRGSFTVLPVAPA